MKTFMVSTFAIVLSISAIRVLAADKSALQLKPEFTGHAAMGEAGGMDGMPGHPAPPPQSPPSQSPPQGEMVTGKVLETVDAGKYTYVRVQVGTDELWAAGLKTAVKVGDTVSFNKGMEMKQFRSETLNRTFPSIYFTDDLHVGGVKSGPPAAAQATAPAANPHGGVGAGPADSVDVSGIKPAEGGKTVRDVFEQKTELSGHEVVLRGKVVKSNPSVMGKNWLHLRDGTTAGDGHNDLTITSPDTAAVGDTVLVHGKVVTDKDFGFGYRYDVMIEDAKVTKE